MKRREKRYFPFTTTFIYDVPSTVKENYSIDFIVDLLYKRFTKEKFKNLKKEGNSFSFIGNKGGWISLWSTDITGIYTTTQNIDFGLVEVADSENGLSIKYTIEIFYVLISVFLLSLIPISFNIWLAITTQFMPMLFGILFIMIVLIPSGYLWTRFVHRSIISNALEELRIKCLKR